MSLIQTNNLTKCYNSKGEVVRAVDNISFTIERGDFITIMGPSGSGKSTLLTMLGGITRPTNGEIRTDDIDIYRLNSRQLANFRREYIGFIFQSFQLVSYLTVIENVMLPLINKGLPVKEQTNKSIEILNKVGLASKSKRLVDELSGGEQQRVAVARALVNDPLILLADEPTGNLDRKNSEGILILLSELNKLGKTILMVTHNQEFEKFSHKSIYLEDGKINNELFNEKYNYEYV